MRLIERLYQYIQYKELSFYAFERTCGMANGYLKKQSKGKGTVGSDMLEKIHRACADLSLMWLITGHGTMLQEANPLLENRQPAGRDEDAYLLSRDDIIVLLREQVAILERSLVDKEKIILMMETKLNRLKTKK